MGYRIRFYRDAKQDVEKFRTTYAPTPLPRRLNNWLEKLAEEAETKEWTLSLDLATLLERIDDAEEIVHRWPAFWQRFWDAKFVNKLKAAAVVISKWRPPYESRGAVRVFTLYSEASEVVALYLVDHAQKEVVFMAFDGLFMQSYD
jgi:hypothetical protein